jgi:hypothetical protein
LDVRICDQPGRAVHLRGNDRKTRTHARSGCSAYFFCENILESTRDLENVFFCTLCTWLYTFLEVSSESAQMLLNNSFRNPLLEEVDSNWNLNEVAGKRRQS